MRLPSCLVLVALVSASPNGSAQRSAASGREARAAPESAVVLLPLRKWSGPGWPSGLNFGKATGISFGDYDGDGWVDFYCGANARLYRNEGGVTWSLAADLDSILPTASRRYGAALGDYDQDGLVDIFTEPRISRDDDDCLHLLHGLGGGPNFEDVALDPTRFVSQLCDVNAETAAWADVDEDGDLDLFLSAYAPPDGTTGNLFFENLGPTGPGGAWVLMDTTAASGLTNPNGVARPEGMQMLDIDRDGDTDAYCNATFYQNQTVTSPSFVALKRPWTGIQFPNSLDEGLIWFDYDLDGDQDLFVVYVALGNKIWENRGDGTFFERRGILKEPRGLGMGMSAADWDLDGDIDLTTTEIFRRNTIVENGARGIKIQQHEIPAAHLAFPTPAWGDWDRDGDLDCLLSNFSAPGRIYENTTYDATTPLEQRMDVRVKPARSAAGFPRGLEQEFGATVEIRVQDDPTLFVRRNFVAGSHGYLSQNEYALTFGLPPGPDPSAPAEGVRFEVLVDFPGLSSRGILRIDRLVNPALGGIELAQLSDREIVVFRNGQVIVDGVRHYPIIEGARQRLRTTTGGLCLADVGNALPDPVPAPGADWYVGIEVDTSHAKGAFQVVELLVDGKLDAPSTCDGSTVRVWDVTALEEPRLVYAGDFKTRLSNRRSFFATEFELSPGRRYRVVACTTQLRGTPISGPWLSDTIIVTGGLSFQDTDPCSGRAVARAEVDPEEVQLALRLRGPVPGRRAGGARQR